MVTENDLLNSNVFIKKDFSGVDVYCINRNANRRLLDSYGLCLKPYVINETNHIRATQHGRNHFKDQLEPSKKSGICLHFTAGNIISDLAVLTGGDRKDDFISVPFVISGTGKIYQLLNPDTELGYHLGTRPEHWYQHNQKIGIEISNIGWLITGDDIRLGKTGDPNSLYNCYGSSYCTLSNTQSYYDLEKELQYGLSSFRGYRYFATYTEEQYITLNKLIEAICSKYNLEKKLLPPEIRYNYFGNNETDWDYILNWRGISSHVNYNGKNQYGNWEKWDIGPAFDWDRLVSLPICHPYGGNKPSTQWFFSAELRGQGGYYPFGMNGAMHNGFHVFSKERLQEVKAIAPGYIIAFRYVRENPQIEGVASSKADSFVLMKHDADVTEGSGEQKSKTQKSFYSMYMDLESIDKNDLKKISWIKKLNTFCTETKVSTGYEDLGDRIETDENSFKREAHEKLKEIKFTPIENDILVDITVNNDASKIITLSEPYLYVEAGETIGYSLAKRKNQSTENFMHLEVFTTEEEAYSAIVKVSGLEQDNSLETMTIDRAQSFLNAGDRGTYFGGTFTSILETFLNSDKQTYGEVVSTHYSQGAAA